MQFTSLAAIALYITDHVHVLLKDYVLKVLIHFMLIGTCLSGYETFDKASQNMKLTTCLRKSTSSLPNVPLTSKEKPQDRSPTVSVNQFRLWP